MILLLGIRQQHKFGKGKYVNLLKSVLTNHPKVSIQFLLCFLQMYFFIPFILLNKIALTLLKHEDKICCMLMKSASKEQYKLT